MREKVATVNDEDKKKFPLSSSLSILLSQYSRSLTTLALACAAYRILTIRIKFVEVRWSHLCDNIATHDFSVVNTYLQECREYLEETGIGSQSSIYCLFTYVSICKQTSKEMITKERNGIKLLPKLDFGALDSTQWVSVLVILKWMIVFYQLRISTRVWINLLVSFYVNKIRHQSSPISQTIRVNKKYRNFWQSVGI